MSAVNVPAFVSVPVTWVMYHPWVFHRLRTFARSNAIGVRLRGFFARLFNLEFREETNEDIAFHDGK